MALQTLQQRLSRIFGTQQLPEVNEETLSTYREHLQRSLEHPCFLFLAHEDGASFEALQLQGLAEEFDQDLGLLALVKRLSDQKEFSVPLAQMECPYDDRTNHRLVDDYCQWFVRATFSLSCRGTNA